MLHTYLGRGMRLIEVLPRLSVQLSIEGQLKIARRGLMQADDPYPFHELDNVVQGCSNCTRQ